MKYRKKLSRKRSKKSFTKGAIKVNRKNYRAEPMRGGIRL
jgi:hypothetical protein